jgi:guanylate kinase
LNLNGVILYGPPASGKDTVSRELIKLDSRYELYRKLKSGSGNMSGYRRAEHTDLDRLRRNDLILYANERYGNTYAVDLPELEAIGKRNRVPIIHMGQVEGVVSLRKHSTHWTTALLWCDRATARQRSLERGNSDVSARVAAWDESLIELKNWQDETFDTLIDTDKVSPRSAAQVIHSRNLSVDPRPSIRVLDALKLMGGA